MGRIKSMAIKRVSRELIETNPGFFSDNFEKNKVLLSGLFKLKKMRNSIAGYITRIIKKENEKKSIVIKSLTENKN